MLSNDEVMENTDCPDIDNVAQADTTDIDTLKKACETQLSLGGLSLAFKKLEPNCFPSKLSCACSIYYAVFDSPLARRWHVLR